MGFISFRNSSEQPVLPDLHSTRKRLLLHLLHADYFNGHCSSSGLKARFKIQEAYAQPEGSFLKQSLRLCRKFAPTRRICAYAIVMPILYLAHRHKVGAYVQVHANACFKKLPSGFHRRGDFGLWG
jgi:hypothetical protein